MPCKTERPESFIRRTSAQFHTTHWSQVLAIGAGEPLAASAALESLCHTYWYPLYTYVRRTGHSPHDAQDLTQAFFARLLDRNDLARVRPEKGRFRSYLLASLKHFLANEWKRGQCIKRGGGQIFVPLNAESAEARYGAEPADLLDAEKLYERRWALSLLERTLIVLRQEQVDSGKASNFDELKIFLTGEGGAPTYAQLARKLGLSENALKMAVSRLRRRYGEILRAAIADTVTTPEEVDEEIQYLSATLSR